MAVSSLKVQFERLSTAEEPAPLPAAASSPGRIRKNKPEAKQSPTVISKKQMKEIGKSISGESNRKARQPKSKSFEEPTNVATSEISAAVSELANVIKSSPSPSSSGGSTPLTQSINAADKEETLSSAVSPPESSSVEAQSSANNKSPSKGVAPLRVRSSSAKEREKKGLSAPTALISKGQSPKVRPKLAPKPVLAPKPLGIKPSLPPKPKIAPKTTTPQNTRRANEQPSPPPHTTATEDGTTITTKNTTTTTNGNTAVTASVTAITSSMTPEIRLSSSSPDPVTSVITDDIATTANDITKVKHPSPEDVGSTDTGVFPVGSPVSHPSVSSDEECGVQSTAIATPNDEIGGCKRNTTDSGYQEEITEEEIKEKWDTAKRNKAREKRKQIALELLETEKTYVGRLKIIAVDFRQAILAINTKSSKPLIPDSTINVIFLNIGEIYNLNKQLLDDLQNRMDHWAENEQIGDVISSIAPFLKLYSMYTAGFEDAMKKLTETMAKEKKLDVTVKEFERSLGTGLGVAHYMLEPIQRIPRYKLLLEAYLKNLPEDSPERASTTKALAIIGEAADKTNNRIKELENSNEILAIQRTLVDYEGTLLLAHRKFLKKGVLQKLSRKTQAPRMFFLFSDVLLHTEPTGPSSYKFKNELPLCAVKMELPKVSLVPHSFELFSTNRSFILSAKSEEEMIEWMTALRGAIRDDKEKMKSLKRGEQLLTLDRSGFGNSAPILVPDQSVSMCQICSKEFTFTFRRHHCRACGRVVCGNCSPHKAYLSYMNKEERVCHVCNQQRKQHTGDEVDGPVDQPICRPHVPSVLIIDHEKEAIIGGYVYEQDGKRWNRCWYVVGKDLALYKFKAHEDIRATETVPLPGYRVTTDRVTMTINLLHHQAKKKKLNVSFRTENVADFETWVDVLEKAAQMAIPELPTIQDNRLSTAAYSHRVRSQSLNDLLDSKPNEESAELSLSTTPPVSSNLDGSAFSDECS